MDAKRCDRCKRFYMLSDKIDKRPSYAGNRMFHIKTIDIDCRGLQTFDVCADCANAFMSWLRMGECETVDARSSDNYRKGVIGDECEAESKETEKRNENA